MAVILRAVVLIAAMAGSLTPVASGVMGQTESSTECISSILSLSPCLPYITGVTDFITFSSKCCVALGQVITDEAFCLCELFRTKSFFGFPINRTRGLSLPAACYLRFASDRNQCKGTHFTPPGGAAGDDPGSSLSPPPLQAESPAPYSGIFRPGNKPSIPSIGTGWPEDADKGDSEARGLNVGIFCRLIFTGILTAGYFILGSI